MKHEDFVPRTGEPGWHKIADYPEFIKWQYKDSPYRVVADRGPRGHWRALFTSWYDSGSYLIRGNAGGGSKGRMIATTAAQMWMDENAHGCPPPNQYGQ